MFKTTINNSSVEFILQQKVLEARTMDTSVGCHSKFKRIEEMRAKYLLFGIVISLCISICVIIIFEVVFGWEKILVVA
jgi:hypothetical protein